MSPPGSVANHPAQRRIGYRAPTPDQTAEAIAALREISTDPELLATQGGIALGAHNPDRDDWVIYKTMADFLIAAGANHARLPYWIEKGGGAQWRPRTGDGYRAASRRARADHTTGE